jgi:hypothetical protein
MSCDGNESRWVATLAVRLERRLSSNTWWPGKSGRSAYRTRTFLGASALDVDASGFHSGHVMMTRRSTFQQSRMPDHLATRQTLFRASRQWRTARQARSRPAHRHRSLPAELASTSRRLLGAPGRGADVSFTPRDLPETDACAPMTQMVARWL